MKNLDRTKYEQIFKAYSKGYSSLYNKEVPFNQLLVK